MLLTGGLCEWRICECGWRVTDLVVLGESTRAGRTTRGTMRDMLDGLMAVVERLSQGSALALYRVNACWDCCC